MALGLILDTLPRGSAIQVPELLFAKIEDVDVAAWAEQFGGSGGVSQGIE